jgi:polysaccharide biosynthesis/export protein
MMLGDSAAARSSEVQLAVAVVLVFVNNATLSTGADMHISRFAVIAVLTLGLLLVGCSPVGSDLPPLPEDSASDATYRLGPGDQLKVTVFDSADLSGEFPVSDTGVAVLPLIGAVQAAGATPRQLEQTVHDKLISGGFVRAPRVTVQIINFRPIYVLGEVLKPGDHPYVPGLTVRAAIALAGGFTYRANTNFVIVTRQKTEFRAPVSAVLRPDDVIQVSERYY